jgi:hypothetical protein
MILEFWLPVRGYENLYEVSNYGNVRSLDRNVGAKCNGSRFQKGVLLKPGKDSRGYMQVGLNRNGISKMHLVHRLVVKAFIAKDGIRNDVNHIDSNRTNNNLENLEWVTKSENQIHAYAMGRRPLKYRKRILACN